MNNDYDIIKRPMVTEKSNTLRNERNQVVFEVAKHASKDQIKETIQRLFKVEVTGVSTSIQHGKFKRVGRSIGRRPNWKKAIVTLKEGQSIELFEGV